VSAVDAGLWDHEQRPLQSYKLRMVMYSCGWGSGALYFAEVLPKAKITAFSNSRTQKDYIDSVAKDMGLDNLTVITGNVVDFEFEAAAFDRVVSIEVCALFSGSIL
jgi:cyclopropane fatty-acyl-phospholipid synthase-like methyltransferase